METDSPAEDSTPVVSVIVPTRRRPEYLRVTLASLVDQEADTPHELIVIDDGPDAETAAVAAAAGVRCLPTGVGHGLNAARNAGLRAAAAPLIAFVDDDVHAPPRWLAELVAGATRHPAAEAFGGPIRARFEGHPPRGCGREDPPITTLDLGHEDREAEVVWGANFAVRRAAVERIGPFEERLRRGHGDEEEWLERLRAAGGTIVYLAHAGLDHRRAPGDARLLPLARAAYQRGRGARASDRRRGRAPSAAHELRVLAGCGWHTVRRACPQGVVMGAHAAGRLAETLRPRPALDPPMTAEKRPRGRSPQHVAREQTPSGEENPSQTTEGADPTNVPPSDVDDCDEMVSPGADPTNVPPSDVDDCGETVSPGADPATFLSGDGGDVTAPWRRLKRSLGEGVFDLIDAARGTQRRVERLADEQAPLRVLVLGVVRPDSLMAAALSALRSERHEVTFSLGAIGEPDAELRAETLVSGLGGGKFENLNSLLAAGPDPAGFDWLVVSDDDLALPPRFLDRFLALCERFELDLAQPAQTLKSHSAWKVARRRAGSLVRETRFVEIGPLTAFRMATAGSALMPFPALRFGWGLDLHWAALAAERDWRLGVVDATPVRHETGLVAASYSNDDAIAEASAFLADRPYLPATAAADVLAVHR